MFLTIDPAQLPLRIQIDGERPQKSKDWKGAVAHHQVPYPVLRTIANQALRDLQLNRSTGLWRAMTSCAYEGGGAKANLALLEETTNYLMDIAREIQKHPLTHFLKNNRLDFGILSASRQNTIEDMISRFIWMPGNIFMGPTVHCWTQTNGFDPAPKRKGGHRLVILESLYNLVVRPPVDWKQVQIKLFALRKAGIANQNSVIPFNSDDWSKSSHGIYTKL